MVLNKDGYIVTNNHVVATAQGDTVTVIFRDGNKASASIVGTDARTDLAVIKVSGVSDLKPATFGSSAKMQVGDMGFTGYFTDTEGNLIGVWENA